MFFYVQLWQHITVKQPTAQERVQAPSEGHAIVQVMRKYHLTAVDRAWVSHSALEPPTVRLIQVYVKGKVRSWRHEPEGLSEPARQKREKASVQ
jgi:hypothetical protein